MAGGHDGGAMERSGHPRRDLGGRHVDMDDVRAPLCGEVERPGRRSGGRQMDDRRVELRRHSVGRSSDDHYRVAAPDHAVGHMAYVALDTSEGVGQRGMDDREVRGRGAQRGSCSTGTRPAAGAGESRSWTRVGPRL